MYLLSVGSQGNRRVHPDIEPSSSDAQTLVARGSHRSGSPGVPRGLCFGAPVLPLYSGNNIYIYLNPPYMKYYLPRFLSLFFQSSPALTCFICHLPFADLTHCLFSSCFSGLQGDHDKCSRLGLKIKVKVKSLSCVRLFATPWTVAYQAPSMGFSRQKCWSGLPFPSPGDLPDPGIEPGTPSLQADALLSEPPNCK